MKSNESSVVKVKEEPTKSDSELEENNYDDRLILNQKELLNEPQTVDGKIDQENPSATARRLSVSSFSTSSDCEELESTDPTRANESIGKSFD